ncbi:sensor histidine kinase [Nocardioides speluncae]|uniref:sensor histidine kinase n=1 Tax=Nocardioides speluncae TaxID=2670337 RepID=UPI000D6988EF|nr:sensor domain-containing protein [Nocardioides speluncae]
MSSPMTGLPASATLGAPASPDAPPSRLALTGYAAAQLLLVIPAILFFVLTTVGGTLALFVIGIPFLLVSLPATRWLANLHRKMAGRILGTPIPPQYRPSPPGGPLVKLRSWATDPMTWRDQAWILLTLTIGFTLSFLVVILFLAIVTGMFWWYGAEPIMKARSMLDRSLLSYGTTEKLEQRVQVLTETRTETIDHSAAELRRIERDLHDGAQARLVALGMNLGMVQEMLEKDPKKANQILSEARSTTGAALGDLRSVVRGIHPPVLADRGLLGAVQALALDMAIPVHVTAKLDGRPPAPVESAVYFAVAECLANTGKHAAAEHAWVELEHSNGVLTTVVGDDGRGGADPGAGTGMRGVMRRLSAFDGTMSVSSPLRGPTLVTLEVPCVLAPAVKS